jgi:LuxR family maltose regulon positive regulatory protein
MDNAIQKSEKAERMVRDIPDLEPDTKVKSINSHTWLLISQNKFTDAENYVKERGLSADIEINYFSEFRQIIYTRVLIHHSRESLSAQKLRVAHNILVKILDLAKPAGYISQMIEALTLQALAYDAQGKNNEAMKSLEEALNLAEPEGYVRVFVDEGDSMQTLLREAESQGIAPNYVPILLAAFETDHIQVKLPNVPSPIEHLSERELEVLRLLKTELSGPEIANELVIALSTLRTHTQNIYSKLGVSSRRAAVRKAEELNLR